MHSRSLQASWKHKKTICQQVRKGILFWWFRESELFFSLKELE